jgi:hypothetical protein
LALCSLASYILSTSTNTSSSSSSLKLDLDLCCTVMFYLAFEDPENIFYVNSWNLISPLVFNISETTNIEAAMYPTSLM